MPHPEIEPSCFDGFKGVRLRPETIIEPAISRIYVYFCVGSWPPKWPASKISKGEATLNGEL
jgi:hypothetical protein